MLTGALLSSVSIVCRFSPAYWPWLCCCLSALCAASLPPAVCDYSVSYMQSVSLLFLLLVMAFLLFVSIVCRFSPFVLSVALPSHVSSVCRFSPSCCLCLSCLLSAVCAASLSHADRDSTIACQHCVSLLSLLLAVALLLPRCQQCVLLLLLTGCGNAGACQQCVSLLFLMLTVALPLSVSIVYHPSPSSRSSVVTCQQCVPLLSLILTVALLLLVSIVCRSSPTCWPWLCCHLSAVCAASLSQTDRGSAVSSQHCVPLLSHLLAVTLLSSVNNVCRFSLSCCSWLCCHLSALSVVSLSPGSAVVLRGAVRHGVAVAVLLRSLREVRSVIRREGGVGVVNFMQVFAVVLHKELRC